MFEKLAALRATLAKVQAFDVPAAAREAIVQAIDELDDAMVADVRLHTYVASLPDTPPASFDMGRFANDYLNRLPHLQMGIQS